MITVLLALGALAAAITSVIVLRAAPRAAATLWLLVLFFVPVWVGASVGPFWSAITVMTVVTIMTCSGTVPFSPADGFVAAFAVLILAQFAIGLTTLPAAVIALAEWLLPYVLGRIILGRVSMHFLTRAIAGVGVIAALLGIFEALTVTNPFSAITFGSATLYDMWAPLQPRGGLNRVEGAFGHSIAFGASLSMCAAFVLATGWRLYARIAALATVAAALVLTLSRIGLVTFVVTVGLSLLVLPGLKRAARVLIGGVSVAAAIIVGPFVSGVFSDAGQEASGSANYRLDLLSLGLVLKPFGAAPNVAGLTIDGAYLGAFARSIDNALMVVAMRVGWVPALLLIIALIIAITQMMRRGGANAANIALAGQVPGLFTVAFITQYSAFFWFTVGLAVALSMTARPRVAADADAAASAGAGSGAPNAAKLATAAGGGAR